MSRPDNIMDALDADGHIDLDASLTLPDANDILNDESFVFGGSSNRQQREGGGNVVVSALATESSSNMEGDDDDDDDDSNIDTHMPEGIFDQSLNHMLDHHNESLSQKEGDTIFMTKFDRDDGITEEDLYIIDDAAQKDDGEADQLHVDGGSTSLTPAKPVISSSSSPDGEREEEAKTTTNVISSPALAPVVLKETTDDKGDIDVDTQQEEVLFDSSDSTLDSNTNPFAQREGKTLTWSKVSMVLATKGDESDRKILNDVWGEVPAKETTAIMGPSGSGKTSLLDVLAGRTGTHGQITVSSDVRLDGDRVDQTKIRFRRSIAFVEQGNAIQITSTPREAIRFSAKLRLGKTTTDREINNLVDKMIEELGLASCADTVVGGERIRGISGGEKKRTAVGVELVVRPSMVFLDEPTSGLDSYSAVQLCQVLKKVANAGSGVLFTIHQPSSEIFDSFDRLILMNKGRVMYQGPVTQVQKFFADRGHPSPVNFNPADWIMNVAQLYPEEFLDKQGFFPKDERGDALEPEEGADTVGNTAAKRLDNDIDGAKNGKSAGETSQQHGFLIQTRMLFTREFLGFHRDTPALAARMGMTTVTGLLIGLVFMDVGAAPPNVQEYLNSQFGALVTVLMMSMFGTAHPALLAFPEERPVFLREYSTNHYSALSYFLSRLTMEVLVTGLQVFIMCIITYYLVDFQMSFEMYFAANYGFGMASTALAVALGCAISDPKVGQEMFPVLFVPQLMFVGFFVAPELIPSWIRWPKYICSLNYGLRIVLVEEFYNCGDSLSDEIDEGCYSRNATVVANSDCESDREEANRMCAELLDTVEADPDEVWWNWLVLVGLFVFCRLLALYFLRQKAQKFF